MWSLWFRVEVQDGFAKSTTFSPMHTSHEKENTFDIRENTFYLLPHAHVT